ncbi:RNA polymerase sigma factor 54 interaction domain [Syntrophomonas zehnderi OL-4]|uniref:RNA polymerase sigma factor 54 interaction domain n=1 Tax=Syntrophomonas zehnderi OL-4 TaxID=690567 RepID=A0A0E4GCV7_9FIRM|nr:sigma-54-dependent Fis family transcriptional regulator [Syntrophomonas zehnderi]CFY07540.1 RNA polymerase sigma factor 54 interaction domain [Syntrophomonas zehnderi OL-4]
MFIDIKHEQICFFKAWEQFIATGELNPGTIRTEIADSWQRCYTAQVDPWADICHDILNTQQLKDLRSQNHELIDIAHPFMVRLYKFVAGSQFIVILADNRGFIMDLLGDDETLFNAAQLNLVAGSNWMEEKVGTNGVGTSLKLKKPVQISGSEHYCRYAHRWTCSAAPIFNDDGQIIAVLQLSGPMQSAHLHTLGMVVAASEAISDQIRVKRQNEELRLLNSRLIDIFQTVSDGAIIIDNRAIITESNPTAQQILGRQLVGCNINDVFEPSRQFDELLWASRAFADLELQAYGSRGALYCLVSGKPITYSDGKSNGAVIFFNPIHKVRSLANRFSGAEATFHFNDIIGQSEGIRAAIQVAVKAAANTSNVLISGESGTGKEIFAQSIHNASPRREGPFIAINCAASPRELIASELFGYVEGAFTGARRGGRPGKFEMASGGTLFLDEIGDMPLDQQATLLRVLQEKKVTRIGGDKVIPVDVRIICATNKNLLEEIEKHNFRQDLFYRLNVILVSIPPLRERPEDIDLLFNYLLQKISKRLNTPVVYVEPGIKEYLQKYNWPGNVRELENVIEKMVILNNNQTLSLKSLPSGIAALGSASTANTVYTNNLSNNTNSRAEGMSALLAERQTIIDLLKSHNGNISKVAREMGLSRNTVYRKMAFYDISRTQSFD